MVGWFRRLFCEHNWEVVFNKSVNVFETKHDKRPVETKWVLIQRCRKCGKIEKRVVVVHA